MELGEVVVFEGDGFTMISHPDSHESISLILGSATYKLWESRDSLFAALPADNAVDNFNDFISVARNLEWLQHHAYRNQNGLTPAQRKTKLRQLEAALKKTTRLLSSVDHATLDDLEGEEVDEAGVHELHEKLSNLCASIMSIIDDGFEKTKTNKKRDDLYDIVDVLGRIYKRRTGKKPANPSYVEHGQAEKAVDGPFYRLCTLVTCIVDPGYERKLQHVIREVLQDL